MPPKTEMISGWLLISSKVIGSQLIAGAELAAILHSFVFNIKVESFVEHRSSGRTPDGESHQRHIFSVVAKKESNNVN